ncbi:LuxR C-terminal-related transcriptional regulator [Nocardiopsis dassonvillei]|jgi:DNA-binding NarL/FixJ family response regulator|uniref:helix-turn-helix transcriptional regulator n=1 Tax=Nocardiopsis dassonvillei TaxID=2014 RepID=UPI00102BA758|nr:LuxR C-terminal-related transcriptional regulator [Nocardiopsis dassonvillei]MCP3012112.1 LuxR C-terminal-related transcriptional regulator [Nocardiopsis dassonvillei]
MTSTHEHVDQLPVPCAPENGPPLIPLCDRQHETMVVGPDSPGTEATLRALRSMDCTAGVLAHFDCPAEAIAHLGQRGWDFVFHVRRSGAEDTAALREAARGARGKHLSVLSASDRSPGCPLNETGTDALVSVDELTPADLHFAFWQLERGRVYLSPGLVDRAAAHGRRLHGVPGPATRLTERERQTLALMARGLENKEIAAQLRISLHGAKRNVAQVLTKLDCTNRTMAVVKAMSGTACGLDHLARGN